MVLTITTCLPHPLRPGRRSVSTLHTAVSLVHNQQLGGLFGGIGHGGGFFGSRTVPLCYPICKGTQKTLTFFWLLLLVKCRSVSM